MTKENESVVSTTATTAATTSQLVNNNNNNNKNGPTALQLTIAAIMLGSSAGFTFYTRRTDSMLRTMSKINENVARNRLPSFGPPTKEEWRKMQPGRWGKYEY